MKKCDNCGKDVGFKQHYKVTRELLLAKKLFKRKVFCSIDCALEYERKQKEVENNKS